MCLFVFSILAGQQPPSQGMSTVKRCLWWDVQTHLHAVSDLREWGGSLTVSSVKPPLAVSGRLLCSVQVSNRDCWATEPWPKW